MSHAATLYYGHPIARNHPLMRGLVARWKTVPWYASGPRWIDLANLGYYHGTLTGGPTWIGDNGRPGGFGALSHDGVDDQVNFGNSSALNPTTEITVSVRMRSSDTTGFRPIFTRYDNVFTNSSWMLWNTLGASTNIFWYTSNGVDAGTNLGSTDRRAHV